MRGYPVTLVGLEDARCVVVGGGQVAARKVAALREAGARPVVISPALCEVLQRQAERGEIQAVRRGYCQGDLTGARLVIAATDDPAINQFAWREARAVGCLVNVVDDPSHGNFHAPATVRRGALTISISTGGNSPALTRRIRETLESEFDAGYEEFVTFLGELRPLVQECVGDPDRRRNFWQALLDSEIMELLRGGARQTARRRALEILGAYR